eukprot:7329969-Pyramimonas_sp.AAC.1
MEKLISYCPTYGPPLRDGIPWVIIRHQVEAECPDLPSFLQEAGNQSHNARQVQTQMQTLLRIHRIATKNYKMHADPKWELLCKDLVKSNSELKGDVEGMSLYVKEWSGGENASYLKELQEFACSLKFRRHIPGSLWKALGSVQLAQ